MAAKEDRDPPYPKIMVGVPGHLHRREAKYLYDAPGRLGAGTYVELGTFHGRSTVCIGGGIKDSGVDAHLTTIDCYELYVPSNTRGYIKDNLQKNKDMFEEKGLKEYITALKAISAESVDLFEDESITLLFIDADHTYKGCKADFEAWLPKVKSGGEIAFHDSNLVDVHAVIDEIPWDTSKPEVIYTLKVVIKP